MLYLLKVLYFLAPAGFGNMAPILMKNILKSFDIPLDSNIKFRGKPLLGKNKTVRGLIMGIIFSLVIIYLQAYLYRFAFFSELSFFDYTKADILLFGFLMGIGALIGDSLKSFVKRRFNIKPGERFIPWDQIDWVLGFIIFTMPVFDYTSKLVVYLLVTGFVMHILSRHIGYYIKINKSKW